MPETEIKFSIEKIEDSNHMKWDDYFSHEYSLWSSISNLCHTVYINYNRLSPALTQQDASSVNSSESIYTYMFNFYKNYDSPKNMFKSVFKIALENNDSNFKKAIDFLIKMSTNDRIGAFYDPILNSLLSNKPYYPSGYYIASCHVDNDVVISMLVVQSPDKKVQTHKFIFRSLEYLVKEAMEDRSPLKSLSLPLHHFAGKALGSQMVVTRPVQHMSTIFQTQPDFKELPDEEAEKLKLGEENWEYMQKYGISDTRYKMTYLEIPQPTATPDIILFSKPAAKSEVEGESELGTTAHSQQFAAEVEFRNSSILSKIKNCLDQMQEKFPPPQKHDESIKANMGRLVSELSTQLNKCMDSNESNRYEIFEKNVNFLLNEDPRAQDLKKPDSLLYPVYYALMVACRTFFRTFDLILSITSERTKNDTPEYKPFFKLPEASLNAQFAELYEAFRELDQCCNRDLLIKPYQSQKI